MEVDFSSFLPTNVPLIQVPHPSPRWPDPIHSGHIRKQGGRIRTWHKRFFILTRAGQLFYFKKETDPDPIQPKPLIVRTCLYGRAPSKSSVSEYCLRVHLREGKRKKPRVFFFYALPDTFVSMETFIQKLFEAGAVHDVKLTGANLKAKEPWMMPFAILHVLVRIRELVVGDPEGCINVFKRGSSQILVRQLMRKFDAHEFGQQDVWQADVYTLANLTIEFLESLASKPFATVYDLLVSAGGNHDEAERLRLVDSAVGELSDRYPLVYGLLEHLFLAFNAIATTSATRVTPQLLADLLTDVLVRPEDEMNNPSWTSNPVARIAVQTMIVHCDDVFSTDKRTDFGVSADSPPARTRVDSGWMLKAAFGPHAGLGEEEGESI